MFIFILMIFSLIICEICKENERKRGSESGEKCLIEKPLFFSLLKVYRLLSFIVILIFLRVFLILLCFYNWRIWWLIFCSFLFHFFVSGSTPELVKIVTILISRENDSCHNMTDLRLCLLPKARLILLFFFMHVSQFKYSSIYFT